MVSIARISSKGQIVIPQEMRNQLDVKEGSIFMVSAQDSSICLTKIEVPKVKSWDEVTRPFRQAAKKSNFTKEDLSRLIEESRLIRK